ncbi:MAG: ABC transporter substrate-binding protein [Desulfobacula sp.]|nr:ABC transporter substrate-binding protein [Desulfobacula sp.]
MQRLYRLVFFLLTAVLWFSPDFALAGDDGTRTLTDMAGRRVVIKDPVNRIVTTFKPASLCVFSLGLAHKLVGVDTSSRQDPLHLAVFPGIAHVSGVGTKSMGINFETLVSLKPDLVILYSQKEGISLADRLAGMNIPSIVILPETFETIKQTLRVIAEAAGDPGKSRYVEDQMDGVTGFVAQRVGTLDEKERKTGYFASALGLFSTTTAHMVQHEIFNLAGLKNVSGQLTGYFQDISPEQLVQWNPDIMVLSQYLKQGETARLFDKALQEIRAISTKAVYRCPSSLAPWDYPSPLSVLASLWVAQKAYPERFSDIEMKDKADEFYQNLFGKTMSEMGGILNDRLD